MGKVRVGDDTYGWGGDVEKLAEDPERYGPKLLEPAEASALRKACAEQDRETFAKSEIEDRQVFLIGKTWRRRLALKDAPGQILQVRDLSPEKKTVSEHPDAQQV